MQDDAIDSRPADAPVPRTRLSRRGFLSRAGKVAAFAAVAGPVSASSAAASSAQPAAPAPAISFASRRAERVYRARLRAAQAAYNVAAPRHESNGVEDRFSARWGSYSKGLPHDSLGQVERAAYDIYLRALDSSDHSLFERIPLGGYLKLSNPQAAFAIDLVGPDAEKIPLAPPPAFSSAEQASELVELYWQALVRDVAFRDYETSPLIQQAAAELSALSDFRGPKRQGRVTTETVFRGTSPVTLNGPYISQFLLRDITMSPLRIPQRIRTAIPGRDYMTGVAEWLNVQNGQLAAVNAFDTTPRYIRNGRDLGEWTHRDFTYQAGVCAAMMLLKMSAPLDGGIPYQYSVTQGGFVTFGPSDILHLVASAANLAMKPAWYQKWLIHRRARPEELGGRVHFHLDGKLRVPLHTDITDAPVLRMVREKNGTWLLPQAYPEGGPSHPAYPAGHAVIAGACVTVLKACFSESWVMPSPVVANADGTALEPYRGPDLTVGGELDKMAENVAIGRNFAAVHWRSDGIEGLRLGEEFAIRYLQEMKLTANEFFTGFSLTRFDGTRITI